jgi:hypothetical protein
VVECASKFSFPQVGGTALVMALKRGRYGREMCRSFSRVMQLLCLLQMLVASGSSLKAAVTDGIRLAAGADSRRTVGMPTLFSRLLGPPLCPIRT